MKAWGSPVPAPVIDFTQPFEEWQKAEDAYIQANRDWLKANGKTHRLAGQIIRFPVGDGYAQYMVIDGRSLMHLEVDDKWQIPEAHSRGLRLSDVEQMIERDKKMDELFGRKP
jgi:hypothetical protein